MQVRVGIEDFITLTAAHPAVRHPQLVGHHFEQRRAGRAARYKTHLRRIVGSLSTNSERGGHQDPAVLYVGNHKPTVGLVGPRQLVSLALEHAGQQQLPRPGDMRTQQRRQNL